MEHNWLGIKGIDADGGHIYYKGIEFDQQDIREYAMTDIDEDTDSGMSLDEALRAEGLNTEECKDGSGTIDLNKVIDLWIRTHPDCVIGYLEDSIINMQTKELFSRLFSETKNLVEDVIISAQSTLETQEELYHAPSSLENAKNAIEGKAYILNVQNDSCSVTYDAHHLQESLKNFSEEYSPCLAILMNTNEKIICQGKLGDNFIKHVEKYFKDNESKTIKNKSNKEGFEK